MYKLYSQRKKEAEQGISDVYIYDKFCRAFRNQYLHIVEDVFGIYPDVKYIYKPKLRTRQYHRQDREWSHRF